jgi:hypothetical protein
VLEGLSDPFEVKALPAKQSFVSSVSCSLSSTTGGGGKQSCSRELRIEAGLAKNFPSWMNPEVARHSQEPTVCVYGRRDRWILVFGTSISGL